MSTWRLTACLALSLLLAGCVCCVNEPGLLENHRIEGASLLQPGQTYQYQVREEICCPPQPRSVTNAVTWSIEPAVEGLELDPATGRVQVLRPLPPEYQGQLLAQVGKRGHVSKTLASRADHPLHGRWKQSSWLGCGTRSEGPFEVVQSGGEPIRELEFGWDRFSVTYTPFETYVDYWGRMTADPDTGTIRFEVTGGNRPPAQKAFEGAYAFDARGRLRLTGLGPCGREFSLSYADSGQPAVADECHFVFTYDRELTTIPEAGRREIERATALIESGVPSAIEIRGHTNSEGTQEYNLALSMRMAEAARQLMVDAGVDPGRITTTGFGEEWPAVAPGQPGAPEANSRVEILLPDCAPR